MTEHQFPTPRPLRLLVEFTQGSLQVDAIETDQTQVAITGRRAEEVRVEHGADGLRVIGPRARVGFWGRDDDLDIRVRVPRGSEVDLRTGSASITLTGEVADASLKSGSGEIRAAHVHGRLAAATGSGDIHVEEVEGAMSIKSGSGDVVVGGSRTKASVTTGSGAVRLGENAGTAVAKTGSGDLEVGTTSGDVSLSTGSGRLAVARADRGRISVKGASGDVRIGVPAGTPVWTDISTVSGRVRSELAGIGAPADGVDHVEVRARTVSGDVLLTSA